MPKAKLLGFRFNKRNSELRIGVSKQAWSDFDRRIRFITRRVWAVSMQERIGVLNSFIRGWMAYFNIAFIPTVFKDRDQWIRRRLRQAQWKQWKKPSARRRHLRELGFKDFDARRWAYTSLGSWRVSGSRLVTGALSNKYWNNMGVVGLYDNWSQLNRAV